jgi:hypothetical protein
MTRLGALRLPLVVALGLLGAGASVTSAQQISLAATQGLSTHRLLGDPRGPSVGLTWPLDERVAARVGVHSLIHGQTRVGRACAGLIEPGTCPEEQLDDRTTLTGVVVGLVATVLRRDRFAVAVVPAAALAGARTKSRGRQTGNTLDASTGMRGIGAGAEFAIIPHTRWPVAVRFGAHVGRLTSSEEPIVDGYSPFYEPIVLTRLEIGVSVWKPRASTVTTTR